MQIRIICSRFLIAGAVILIALATSALAQTAADTPPKDSSRLEDVLLLRQQIAEQQKEIEQLRTIVEQMQQKLGLSANPAQTPAKQASSLGQVASTTPMVPKGDSKRLAGLNGPDLQSVVASAAQAVGLGSARGLSPQGAEERPKSSPLSVRLGDAEFTPGGFLDLTEFFRSTNVGSGIGTSFGSIPYSVSGGAVNPASQLTETRFSAQNSRVSFKVTSRVGRNNVAGYVETDFVGNSATNLFQTSNSASLRLRLYWVDFLRGKWEILGGQSWTMMTPGRNGISPVPDELFLSNDMDTNYQVGLTWARQGQFRVVYHPSKQWAVGVSIENPDQFITSAVTLPGGSSGPYASQFDIGGNQTSTPNLMPDIIAKVAYDPMLGGKHMHAELGGLLSSFRDYIGSTNTKSTKTGGGVTVGLNLEAVKDLHLVLNGFYSAGGGRYIFGLAPDVVVKPDGTLATARAGSGIVGLEYQLKKTMLYAYYGAAYIGSTAYVSSYGMGGVPTYVGYGYPGSPNSANRVINEPTFGFIQTFWKNPKYGALQWVNQYSYLERVPWYVAPGSSKNAHLSMVYTDLRYVLP